MVERREGRLPVGGAQPVLFFRLYLNFIFLVFTIFRHRSEVQWRLWRASDEQKSIAVFWFWLTK